MKMAVEIAKVIQVGAGTGILMSPVFLGHYRTQEANVVEIFWVVCVVLALISPVFLWLAGERTRAWQGLVLTVALAVLGAAFSGPVLIQ
ncbi:MAG: hypothetical protein CFE26_11740 [Verrucomicrobiales bacterium VVV1]|nr:MAG: hypothetical protein CFE26_11740 [Verrucomicrobiales bacterium VVV1]